MDFTVPAEQRAKMKENKRNKYLEFDRARKKLWDIKVTVIPVIYLKRYGKGARRVENQRTCRDHPNYSSVNIGQNSEKSPGDWRRLVVTCAPVKDHELKLTDRHKNEEEEEEEEGKYYYYYYY